MRDARAAAVERRSGRYALAGAIAVPVGAVVASGLIFRTLARLGAPVWMLGLGAVVGGLGALVLGLILLRGYRQRIAERIQASLRAEAAAWARAQQWAVYEGPGDPATRSATDAHPGRGPRPEVPFPDRLRAPGADPRRWDQTLIGSWDGRQARVESWQVWVRPAGTAWAHRRRRQFVRIRTDAELPRLAAFDAGLVREVPGFVPVEFTGLPIAVIGALAHVGDHGGQPLVEALAEFTSGLRATGGWVVLQPQEVTLIFGSDADGEVLPYRLALAAGIARTVEAGVRDLRDR